MSRLITLAGGAALLAALVSAASAGAAPATLCVGPQAGCYSQIQPALDAASDGDTITIAAGTFTGGITISKSVHLDGAGANRTTIDGGGPVVTIFRADAPEDLSVTIDGVTITGGVNDSQPDGAVTFGGGIAIPTSQLSEPPFNGTGATVAISNSVITGNTVTSNDVIPPGFCGGEPCGFNDGGGIDNGGVLTLTNTRVTNNTAGSTATVSSAASSAGSGGIDNRFASTLILRSSVVSGNRAVVDSPIANSASSGGIGSVGALDIADSDVSDNVVDYRGVLSSGDESGLAGGIEIDACCDVPHPTVSIRGTRISGNHVSATNTNADSGIAGYGGGIVAFAPALLDHVSLTDNTVKVSGAGFVGGDGGAMEVDAPVTLRDSTVSRNSVDVSGPGAAVAFGGGVAMFGGDLTLERTTVTANSASATGAGGPLPFGGVSTVYGGGISNGGPGVPPAALTLTSSVVTANRLTGSPGFVLAGGGVFTDSGLTSSGGVIAGNKPDDCSGC
ncbi:MAG TPA: hypothetical protein VFU56_02500 [Gaiellaceae bacterium]|nr:hypothetical protein [Gaiellaceae bacterium]